MPEFIEGCGGLEGALNDKHMKIRSSLLTTVLLWISLTGFSQNPNLASSSFSKAEPVNWKANWIWFPGQQKTINYTCFARKQFNVKEPVKSALLNICGFTDYILYINGTFVGRGPTPSDPAYQSYDTYDVKALLKSGVNTIAVACHNYGVGIHWQYAGPGGLIYQLEMDTPSGS